MLKLLDYNILDQSKDSWWNVEFAKRTAWLGNFYYLDTPSSLVYLLSQLVFFDQKFARDMT